MNYSARTGIACLALAMISMSGLMSQCHAATITMLGITGTGARNFSDASIWPASPGVPSVGDLPVIDNGDGINDYVYIDTNTEIQRFNVGNTVSGGLEIRPGVTLTTNATSNSQSNVGQNGIGYLRIKSGATLTQGALLNLGLNAGTGTATLESGATHTLGNFLGVGGQGTGVYNMLGGSLTVGNYIQLGWNSASGNGTFNQMDGTVQINRVNASGQGLFIGSANGATALYEISGGALNVAASNTGINNGALSGASSATFRIVGSSPTISVGASYVQKAGATLDLVIDGGGIGLIDLGADATLDGSLSASFTTVPLMGAQYHIIKYAGHETGTFASFDSLVDSPLGPDSVQLSINYGSGTNDYVTLTVVPEPESLVLGGVGLALLSLSRRRRRPKQPGRPARTNVSTGNECKFLRGMRFFRVRFPQWRTLSVNSATRPVSGERGGEISCPLDWAIAHAEMFPLRSHAFCS
jgi:hypothetical protein